MKLKFRAFSFGADNEETKSRRDRLLLNPPRLTEKACARLRMQGMIEIRKHSLDIMFVGPFSVLCLLLASS